jgi:LacI family transcriptional regulator, galactose operon repressor
MTQGRVTLRDVAQHVGVHPSTVSRALNPETRHMVTGEIAAKVERAARSLGYRPNPMAYSLKTNRSLTVGVIIPDLTNPLFPPIIRGIEDELGKLGYTAVIANTDNDFAREKLILDRMRARRVDGLILATARRNDPLLAEYRAEGVPLVLVNRDVDDHSIRSVINDDAEGIRLAIAHLAGLGHRRIADIAGPQGLSTGFQRHQAYLRAITDMGLETECGLIMFCEAYSIEAGRRRMSELLASRRDFTAAMAGNDLIALGCYDALRDAGLSCPDDVSIVGFNDMPFIDKMAPPLTTVRIRHYDIGAAAARAMLSEIDKAAQTGARKNGPPTAPAVGTAPATGTAPAAGPEIGAGTSDGQTLLPCELIVRGSTAAAAGGA